MLEEIERFHCEKQVEKWYYEAIQENGLKVFHQYPCDGIIYYKEKNIYGVLETKFDRAQRNQTITALRQAFIQAIWYTFQVDYNFKFFIIGSQKHFGIFYLDEYEKIISYLRDEYNKYKYTASEAGRMYYNFIYFKVFDKEYHNLQNKINQLQNVFKS